MHHESWWSFGGAKGWHLHVCMWTYLLAPVTKTYLVDALICWCSHTLVGALLEVVAP